MNLQNADQWCRRHNASVELRWTQAIPGKPDQRLCVQGPTLCQAVDAAGDEILKAIKKDE